MAVDPPTRHSMERLLKTWWSVFPAATLQPIDAFVASQKTAQSAPHVPPQIATVAQVPQMQQAGAPPMMGVQAQMQQPLVGAGGFNMAVQQPMQQSMGMPALISAMPPPNMQMQQPNGVVGGVSMALGAVGAVNALGMAIGAQQQQQQVQQQQQPMASQGYPQQQQMMMGGMHHMQQIGMAPQIPGMPTQTLQQVAQQAAMAAQAARAQAQAGPKAVPTQPVVPPKPPQQQQQAQQPSGAQGGAQGANQAAGGDSGDAIEFGTPAFKVRNERVIRALYSDQPHQCKADGRRFRSRRALDEYHDALFERRKRAKERGGTSRQWYVSSAAWLSGVKQGESEAPSFFQKQKDEADTQLDIDNLMVPADDNQPDCVLCGEPFEVEWSAKEEEWMYKGVVRDSSLGGKLVHAKCRSNSGGAVADAPAAAAAGGASQVASGGGMEVAAEMAQAAVDEGAKDANGDGAEGRVTPTTEAPRVSEDAPNDVADADAEDQKPALSGADSDDRAPAPGGAGDDGGAGIDAVADDGGAGTAVPTEEATEERALKREPSPEPSSPVRRTKRKRF